MSTDSGRVTRSRGLNPTFKSVLIIIFVVIVLIIIMLVAGNRLQNRIESNEQRIEQLNSQIEEEKLRTEDIEALREYMESDEYLEQAAKEKLGLIKDGEIIFKEEN